MGIYERYAQIYDSHQIGFSLRIIPYLDQVLTRHQVEVDSALDLACGTGTVARSFAARGWETYGIDLSPAMLAEARRKAEAAGAMVAFSQQDMRSFILPHPVSLVTCFYDSLNYLLSVDDLRQTFGRVANALRLGGFFLFDMNTPWFLEHGWDHNTFYLDCEPASVVMQSEYDPQSGQAAVAIIAFVKRGELYEKFVERHTEQGYSMEQIREVAEAGGLQIVASYDCFTFDPATPQSRRIFWVTRKPTNM